MEKNRGYTMPLLTKKSKKDMRWALILLIPATILAGFLEYRDWMSGKLENPYERIKAILYLSACVIAWLGLAGTWITKIHFVPEGIAVTLFGITLKRRPVERIRLITAVRYQDQDKIALCDYSLEELMARVYDSKPKLFRDSKQEWPEEWTYQYLRRKHTTGKGEFRDYRIYWIWWDPERLQALRSLYPQAPWVDLSKDKIFDKQLEELSSPKPQYF